MKSLFGSLKDCVVSAKKAVSEGVTKVKNTVQRYAGEAKNAICKGAKAVTKAVVAGMSSLKTNAKKAIMWLIKKTTALVGTLYHKIWGDHIKLYNNIVLFLQGNFIKLGLNLLGATNYAPLNDMCKVLAAKAFKAANGLFGFITDKTGFDMAQFATETFMFGFKYDEAQGITYTDPDAPQKYAGYTPLYDLASRDIGFNIAAQIITFNYGGKEYMVETWKGDYWGAAGCEIGLYSRLPGEHTKDQYLYNCATDETMNMKSTLSHGSTTLFTREEKHWWLTGFKPGEYLQPTELDMKCQIEFPDTGMRDAFYASLKNCNTATNVKKSGTTVSWDWKAKNTESIEDTISNYTGGKDYDTLLGNTLDEFVDMLLK